MSKKTETKETKRKIGGKRLLGENTKKQKRGTKETSTLGTKETANFSNAVSVWPYHLWPLIMRTGN